jgi:hypothetical protein
VCPAPEDTPMGPEQSRSKMVSLQDFDLIRVGLLGLGKGKYLFWKLQSISYVLNLLLFTFVGILIIPLNGSLPLNKKIK